MTRSMPLITHAAGMTALCLGLALAVAAEHAVVPCLDASWALVEQIFSVGQVVFERLLHGDLGGAVKALT